MTEPVVSVATVGGITVLGIVTGLHPALMLAGAWGGWWAMSYQPPLGWWARLNRVAISSAVAAWATPPSVGWLFAKDWLPDGLTPLPLEFVTALGIGLVAVDVLGRGLLKLSAARMGRGQQ